MTVNAPDLKIGFSANLISGLNPDWNPQANQTNILYPPEKPTMKEKPVSSIDHRGDWSYPEISLHETAQSLLDNLIPYQIVNPSSDIDAPTIGAGALLVGAANSKTSLEKLSKTIGVDLSNEDFRYALVKLNRQDGNDSHASAENGVLVHLRPRQPDIKYGLTEDFKTAGRKLCHAGRSRLQDYGDKVNKDNATKVLNSFSEYGTHFVSTVGLGDCIMQVFAYPSKQFATIQKAYADGKNPLSGPGSQDFAQFTTSLAEGVFGFVEQYGSILCLSNSETFKSTLKAGDWMDTLWSHKNSVFSLFNPSSKLSLVSLQKDFTEQAPIDIQLTSLSLMLEHKRSLIWQRLFKAAMVQKYRTHIEANFATYDHRDFVQMLPEDQAGIVSFIATPTINLYKTRLDIANMQFVAKDEVNSFVLFANVLSAESAATIKIPGDSVRIFGQVLDMRTNGQAKSISLSDKAIASLEMGCDEFLGALSIQNRSGTIYHVIVDGLKFGLEGDGPNAVPVIEDDVRVVPPVDALPLLINSFQFSMTFAEAVMSDQSSCPNDQIQAFIKQYLKWLAKVIPSDTQDEELIALRVRVMDLANYAINPTYGSFVPILPYTDYEAYVQSILDYLDRIQLQIAQNNQKIANRRQEELTINVAKTLNQNIIASGELISGVIDANVAQQKDLEGFYDSLITQKKAEAAQQQTKLNDLKAALFEAQGDMDLAVQQYKSAVEKWATMEAIKFGLDVATNLFSLGTTIAVPATSISAVKDLGKNVQLIQKTLNILNATSKLYTGIETGLKGLQGAQKALDGLDGADFGSPSTLSWDEMSIQFNKIIATGPNVTEAKANLDAAFKILILRGKAATNAAASLHAVQREIYTSQQQKEINSRQADRLAKLQNKLHPASIGDLDKAGIDLMALTGQLSFVQNQMLTILAKAFLQQDLALQYTNLQPATPVGSFSLLKFSAAIVQQKGTTIEAKSRLNQYQAATTKPIDFVIEGVKPEEVINGSVFRGTIFLNAPEFYPYVDARVVSVVASIDGVESTDSGEYLLKLAFSGTPFHDRNIERDPLNFRTPWRERVYGYNAADNTPTFSDGGKSWSDGVSRVTPFSTWEISFPNTKTNKGLKFNKAQLTIKLSFVLEARVVDAAKMAQMRAQRRISAMAIAMPRTLRAIAPTVDSASVTAQLAAAAAPALPSSTTLVNQMFAQGSCTNDWDVVFNMGLEEINNTLKAQYEDLKKNTQYKNTIQVDTSEDYPGEVTVINKFTIDYGYPLLNFSINNDNSANLEMEILSGTVQKCSKVGTGPENCESPESITGETLTAVIQLAKVAGTVEVDGSNHNVLKVQLDMKEGAFSISNINLSDATKVEFNKEVKAYFVNNPVIFLINQLDLTTIPTLEALKPNDFIFKPLQTPSGNKMLQLFVMTGGRSALNYSQAFLNNIPEPLPQGEKSSMMFRSGLIFSDVLPQSLNNNGWALEGVNPGDTTKAWSGKLTSASVTGTVDLSPLNHTSSTSSGHGSGSITQYTYSIPGGNDVSWSLNGTTITVQSSGQLHYGGTQKQTLKYTQKACYSYYPCLFNCDPSCSNSTLSSDVNVNVTATLPMSVGGSGRNQTVQITTESKGVTATGHLSGGGPSGSDDLEAQVNQQIQKQVPQQIANKLSFSFTPVSVFALKNLLFPANNYITFSSSAVPGDLLLLGNFTQEEDKH